MVVGVMRHALLRNEGAIFEPLPRAANISRVRLLVGETRQSRDHVGDCVVKIDLHRASPLRGVPGDAVLLLTYVRVQIGQDRRRTREVFPRPQKLRPLGIA